jgi:Spy/CpxP family protein refolding chaperone
LSLVPTTVLHFDDTATKENLMPHKGLRTFCLPALLLTLGVAFAFGKDGNTDGRQDKRLDHAVAKMEKELSLTKEQSAKVRSILAKDSAILAMGRGHHAKFAGRHGAMGMMPPGPLEDPHGEFSRQLRASTVDVAALNKQFEDRIAEMRLTHARRVATFAEIHAVLTPEQRAKAADAIDQRLKKMERK